jgi:hypothetical protein
VATCFSALFGLIAAFFLVTLFLFFVLFLAHATH